MKNNNAKHALGTVLVCVGFLCLVIALAGYLTYGSADPASYQVNDDTRTAAIAEAKNLSERSRRLLGERVDALLSLYENAGSGERRPFA